MKKTIWQNHHITYDPERLAVVTRSEHFYLTKVNRFGSLSLGFRDAMKYILENKPIRYKDEK